MNKPTVVRTSGSTKIQPETVNIDGSDDAFYRYKMRQLFVQVVGKGKMIKTVLLNVDDVAKDLKVHPQHMTAYFGYEIGVQSKYDGKKPDRERAMLSGDRDTKELIDVHKKFIKDFVLCPRCKLPETKLQVEKKSDELFLNCLGCGAKSQIYLKDRFHTFIMNHSNTAEGAAALKKKTGAATATAAGVAAATAAADTTEPKASVPSKTGAAKKTKSKKAKDEDDDYVFSCDISEDAVRKRRLEMIPESASNLTTPDIKELISDLEETLKNDPSADLAAEIKKIQAKSAFNNQFRAQLVFDVLFPQAGSVVPEVSKNTAVLSKVIEDEESQQGLLKRLEQLANENPALLANKKKSKIMLVLKRFYDADILSEEEILKWDEKALALNDELRQAVAPLVSWLKEAEEESE